MVAINVNNARRKEKKPFFVAAVLVVSIILLMQLYEFDFSDDDTLLTAAQAVPSSLRERNIDTSHDDCCDLARRQSLGFFTDIADRDWLLKSEIYHSTQPNMLTRYRDKPVFQRKMFNNSAKFWEENFEPEFTCPHERRLGGLGDGGKWVCDPHRIGQVSNDDGTRTCLVYSVGSNGNAHFEESVRDVLLKNGYCTKENLEIHTFDLKHWNKRNGNFKDRVAEAGGTFHNWGMKTTAFSFNTTEYRLPKVFLRSTFKTFAETFKELGHSNRQIDIMKIDCEGCEWQSLKGWFQDYKEQGVLARQILLELHDTPPDLLFKFFDTMKKHGYVITHKEHTGTTVEYAFLKLHLSFFEKQE